MCVSIFANYVQRDLGPDEGMYLSASYAAVDHAIYSDFSFFQTPYLPLSLSRVFQITGTEHPFLCARIITYIHHVLMLVLVALIAFHYTKSAHVAAILTLIASLNRIFFDGASTLHNNTFANAFALLAFYTFLIAFQRKWSTPWLAGACGVSAAIAVGFKLTYLTVFGAFTCVVVGYALKHRTRLIIGGLVIPYAAGVGAGISPLVWIALTRFDAFVFNNVSWHALLMGVAVDGAGSRIQVLTDIARDMHGFADSMKGLGLWALLVPVIVALALRAAHMRELLSVDRVLVVLILASTLVELFIYVHVPHWYLGPIVLFAAIVVASLFPALDDAAKRAVSTVLAGCAVYMVVVQLPILDNTVGVFDRDRWIPSRYVATAKRFDFETPVAVVGNPALVYAVEAKLPLAPWAPTSAFTHQSSLMTNDEFWSYHVGTYSGIEKSLERGEFQTLVLSNVYADADATRELGEKLLSAGFRPEVVGEGSARVVVYRAQGTVR